MSRVALVTTGDAVLRGHDVDLEPVRDALRAVGIDTETAVWDDADVDWGAFDLALMRSPWDYSERLQEFLGWMDTVAAATTVHNPPEVIRWNLDKRYLLDLEARGIAVVPTTLCDTLDEVTAAVGAAESGHLVVKPSVSAASRDTELLETRSPRVLTLAEHILGLGKTVMVQPAIESVATEGEIASLFFDGSFSHAVHKGPILAPGGGFAGGGEYVEEISPIPAPDPVRDLVGRAMDVLGSLCQERFGVADPLLYARLDTVAGPDGPLLLEAELFEPSYFVDGSPGAVERFAAAVARRLG